MLFQEQAEQRVINDPLDGSADTEFATNLTRVLTKVERKKAALVPVLISTIFTDVHKPHCKLLCQPELHTEEGKFT